ncbi:hypothetical protein Cylst_3842 [Cylindrospermum stagnale PCC 7417]|uniref:Uncharacterized protein n=1 Tax=Cylindrospermum stagnale PCC 7417 TaxID=56107 RepID=K9X2L4_9NOST|nr:hypothetical protein [Cylindrospermum stagnale]AFZ25957.1 hypothetical protein Cylst_3842 [Cylindrospermum stagnale PCC 7417]
MLNQKEVNSNPQTDTFAEALAAARKMQQEWLNYGLDFVHLYVEDVDGDWLENWGSDEDISASALDSIKEFLVSDDAVAVKIRQNLGERSLFELAVNLEESWSITEANLRRCSVRNLLIGGGNNHETNSQIDDVELWDLADNLLAKFAEIL